MTLYTIGFTKKTAEQFFGALAKAGVRKLVDTRLNNRSQLAGFSKADDLRYFSRAILGAEYAHVLDMAPTEELLSKYKKQRGSWSDYSSAFNELLQSRNLINIYPVSQLEDACLLCSEHEPTHCHRRLVAEYYQGFERSLQVIHLR